MSFHLVSLGIISALAVIVPGIVLLALLRGVKIPVIRNLTIVLALFGILHGAYHLLALIGLPTIGNPVNLAAVIVLIIFGAYYGKRVS